MPLMFLVLILVGAPLIEIAYESSQYARIETRDTQTSSLGVNMLVVRNALNAFQKANPAIQGPVDIAQLGLPSWFKPDLALRLYIESGQAYIYYTPDEPMPNLNAVFGKDPPGLAGIAHLGWLISPRLENNFTLPSIIPDKSYVLVM